MDPGLMTILLFGSMVLLLMLGLPLTFALGGVAVVFTFFLWGEGALNMVGLAINSVQMSFILVCTPLFIFMGNILERAGIADALFEAMYHWVGPLPGGLAMGTVFICTIFAAMAGVSSVATVTMGLIALPAMLRRNYNKTIAMGSIMAGGALGPLIPPSVTMIIYGFMAEMSIGQLFIGGIIPGLILSSLFCLYIGIRCSLQSHLGPPVPLEETVSWRQKLLLLRGLILPVFLIFSIMGSIFLGIASPSEAAAVGALGALICAAINRRLTWNLFKDACYRTLRMGGMVLWIVIGAKCFTAAYSALGGQQLMRNLIAALAVNRWVVLIAMMASLFFLGMILDVIGIIFITVPVYVPVIVDLGFNPLWFGILFFVNMEMAYLTPPFGFNLFYMRAVTPDVGITKGITMGDIYRAIIPFVAIQMTVLILVLLFPQLALWLPSLMIKGT